jgi:hypothetical protein
MCWANAIMSATIYVVFFPSLVFVLAATCGVVGVLIAWVTNTAVHAMAALGLAYSFASVLGGWPLVRCLGELSITFVVISVGCGILTGRVLSIAVPSASVPID